MAKIFDLHFVPLEVKAEMADWAIAWHKLSVIGWAMTTRHFMALANVG